MEKEKCLALSNKQYTPEFGNNMTQRYKKSDVQCTKLLGPTVKSKFD